MTGEHIAIVLDAGLALDHREAQISHDPHAGTGKGIEDGCAIVYPEFQGQIQNQCIDQHPDQSKAQTAQDALNGLIGADHRGKLMPPKAQAHKIGPGIREERNRKGQQNEIAAVLPHQDANQGAQQQRDQVTAQCTKANGLHAYLHMVQHNLGEQEHEVNNGADH